MNSSELCTIKGDLDIFLVLCSVTDISPYSEYGIKYKEAEWRFRDEIKWMQRLGWHLGLLLSYLERYIWQLHVGIWVRMPYTPAEETFWARSRKEELTVQEIEQSK